ncbi:hypothetical protein GO308_07750 [Sphingomonas sp. SFZ2018-12]|uniref:hypothetical protein n=1 Tax=Sphingomonas sp. SFZ2018-12 TaxID=2683197 RepID=UPI001F0D55EA|nr:hypothetical protein [Sphingomonas sp. SFZ2018-12]MCH4892998.1 hypothetical protein [Sphingomonas sp. SFZ2018-12]
MKPIVGFLSEPLVGTALGFIGVTLAVYFYFKSKQVARLALQSEEIAVVGSATSAFDQHLEVRFEGELVQRVTKTRVIIWNSGNTTIEGSRITEVDPLRAVVDAGSQILRVELVRQTRPVNGVKFTIDERQVLFSFDFFDPNDGFVVEFIHSGTRGELEWFGTIRGIPTGLSTFNSRNPIERLVFLLPKQILRTGRVAAPLFATLLGVGMATAGLFSDQLGKFIPGLYWPLEAKTGPQWLMVATGALYASLPLGMLWMTRRRFPAALDVRAKPQSE